MSRYQKSKTNLEFTEARDSEWQWHQLGHMQVCTLLQTDNNASTPPLSFLQAGCPSCRPTNTVKALKAQILTVQQQQQQQPFNGCWSGTTRVGRYQKKHSPTHTHPDHRTSFITLTFTTINDILFVQFTSLTVLLYNISPGPLWSSSWSWTLNFILHTFLHPLSSFRSTCPYQRSLFCCNPNAMSSIPSLSLN